MNRPAVAALLCAVAFSGAWFAWSAKHSPIQATVASSSSAAVAQTPRRDNQAQAALANTPQAKAYLERRRFSQDVMQFFAQARSLDPASRRRAADALREKLRQQEAEHAISAGESMMLQIGLVREVETDPDAQAAALAALNERFKADADRDNQAWLQQLNNDARFQRYKQDERRIVDAVMAMSTIPGGLSRDEYLRQQLQQAREADYSGGS